MDGEILAPWGVGTCALRTPSDRRSGTQDGMHVEKSGVNRKCHVCKSFEGFSRLPDRLGGRGREKQSLNLRRDWAGLDLKHQRREDSAEAGDPSSLLGCCECRNVFFNDLKGIETDLEG